MVLQGCWCSSPSVPSTPLLTSHSTRVPPPPPSLQLYPFTAPRKECLQSHGEVSKVCNSSADKDLEIHIQVKLIPNSDMRGAHLSTVFETVKMRQSI